MKNHLPIQWQWLRVGVSLFAFLVFNQISAQINIAPNAVVTASSCNMSACSALNDQNYGVCGVPNVSIPTFSPPFNFPGFDWIEWNWTNPQTFDEMVIYHGQINSHFLTGAIMEYWDGTSWQNHYTFSNLPIQCENSITFPRLTTNRMRITNFFMTGLGQNSNPSFREIEIYSSPTSPNDAGVTMLVAPTSICPGSDDVIVRVRNFGTNPINSVTLNWRINGVMQTPTSVSVPIDTIGGNNPHFIDVNLGSHTFSANTPYTIEAWTSMPNGQMDSNILNDSISRTVAPSASGTYSINALISTGGTNFSSFSEFANFLNVYGICGPIVVDVMPGSGPYIERVVFDDIEGASTTNTITINGNGNLLGFSATGLSNIATLNLKGTKYMSIDSLTIAAFGASFGWTMHLSNGADYNSFTNMRFEADLVGTSTSLANVVAAGDTSSALSFGNNSNFTSFDNCNFIGGYYGLVLNGDSTTNRNVGNSVTNCTFEEQNYCAAYLNAQDSLTFSGNDISRETRTTVSSFFSLYLINGISRAVITNNIIHDIHSGLPNANSSNSYPFYMQGATGVPTQPNIMANNLVYNIKSGGNFFGLWIVGFLNDYWKFYHNTIALESTSMNFNTHARMVNFNSAQHNFEIKNNIFYHHRPNSTNFMIYMVIPTNDIEIDNNVYYTPNPNAMTFGYNGTNLNDFSDWQAAGHDPNGIEVNPVFATPGLDYHPTVGSVKARGENLLSVVPFDLNGNPRTTSPDPGALQFDPTYCSGAFSFVVDTVFPGGAEISWQSVWPVNEWQVEWDTCGFTPGFGNLLTMVISNSNFQLTLPMGECICVYVREKCIPSGYGVWTGPIKICVPNEHDAELKSLVNPLTMSCGDSLIEVKVEIQNNAFFPITSMPITVNISGDLNQTLTHTYTGNLQENEVDTVVVGTINLYHGGVINLEAFTSLPNDQITQNDTLKIDSLIITPNQPPTIDNPTYCPGDPDVTVIMNPSPTGLYEWYDQPTGGAPVATGDTIQWPTSSGSLYVGYSDRQDSLTTILQGPGGCDAGNMFNITPNTILNISGFSVSPRVTQTNMPISLYIVSGGYEGTIKKDWTFVDSTTIPSVTRYNLARFNLTNPLTLNANTTYGIYLMFNADYSSGPTALTFSNADMTLTTGIGLCTPFDYCCSPRPWMGVVHYEVTACSDIRTEVIPEEIDSVQAGFTWNTISHTVEFISTSQNADYVIWNLGGIASLGGDSISYQFPRTDSFNVCLTAFNQCGSAITCQMVWAENIAVKRYGELDNLRLFPNPSSGELSISFDQQLPGDLQLDVVDMSGRIVFKKRIKDHHGRFESTFDLRHLSSGMYQLRIQFPDGLAVRSFVIN
ncbi:MAG: T9SS type A sorting domain-containing protein [Cryomorphaceae bacterium]|nr:T9SS type A sorting domain-containing protein [Cryomorphaceae bacterium]